MFLHFEWWSVKFIVVLQNDLFGLGLDIYVFAAGNYFWQVIILNLAILIVYLSLKVFHLGVLELYEFTVWNLVLNGNSRPL